MLRYFADLLDKCTELDPSLDKTPPEKIQQVYKQLDIIVPFLRRQLSNISNGDSIDKDAIYHSFFTKFFTPIFGGSSMRYVDDSKFEQMMRELSSLAI